MCVSRSSFLAAVFLAIPLATAQAQAQSLPLLPLTQVSEQALSYVTYNGSYVSRLGNSNPDQIIGRAVPCSATTNGVYTLAPSAAYPLEGGRRYRAEASSTAEPLMILARGVISGQLGVGPLSANAANNQLTRLDISETVRLSIDTGEGDEALGDGPVKRLFSLASELTGSNTHWCIVTGVSVWRVRYETYRQRSFNASVGGLWIVSGGVSYSRDDSAIVPYQVMTISITPYSRTWVSSRAEQIRLADPSSSLPLVPRRQVELQAVTGSISDAAIADGDAQVAPR